MCDNVVNFEVVLSSGQVVDANEKENSDLWVALRGGSSNFGIVTCTPFPRGTCSVDWSCQTRLAWTISSEPSPIS